MRKWLKRLLIILLTCGLVFLVIYLIPEKRINGMYLIPSDAMYILESEDPIDAWKAMSSSGIWKTVKKHPLFSDITRDADYLDELIESHKLLGKLFGARQFYMSAHTTSRNNFDFLFLVDLKKSARTPVFHAALEKVLRGEGYSVTSRDYKGVQILELKDEAQDVLSLAKVGNFLLCSYTPQLLNRAIDQQSDPFFGIDYHFSEVYKPIAGKGNTRLYVQWKYLDDYLSCYFTDGKSFAAGLDESLLFSALELTLEEKAWELNGLSSLNTEEESVMKALLNSGSSELMLPGVLSNRAAWYVSLNFSSMQTFYKELLSVLSKHPEKEKEFLDTRSKVEGLLGISLEEHLISWIGNEVGIAQIEPANLGKSEEDLVIVLHTNDLTLARKRLDEIAAQVKKRTPAKVKSLQYKNYKIEFLAIKGFFKILFGKLFDKIERPYYTIVGDYVVFSNSPLTLIGFIEDYENDRTLSSDPTFQDVVKTRQRSSLHAYVAPPAARPLLSKHLSPTSRKGLSESAELIDGFKAFVLELKSDGELIYTRVQCMQDEPSSPGSAETADIRELYGRFLVDVSGIGAADSALFRVQYTEGNTFRRFFPASEQAEIVATMKDGMKHGEYSEFYPNGTLRVSGRYRRDKKTGIWKYYNENGELTEKKKF